MLLCRRRPRHDTGQEAGLGANDQTSEVGISRIQEQHGSKDVQSLRHPLPCTCIARSPGPNDDPQKVTALRRQGSTRHAGGSPGGQADLGHGTDGSSPGISAPTASRLPSCPRFSTCSLHIIHMAIEPLLAVSSYSPDLPRPIWNVSTPPFGPDGIFDPAQSDAILKAISRFMLLDDKEGGRSFFGPPIPVILPSDRRDQQATLAERIAEWIVYSISPLCETQEHSMLSGLESLVDSVCLLYHPGASAPD